MLEFALLREPTAEVASEQDRSGQGARPRGVFGRTKWEHDLSDYLSQCDPGTGHRHFTDRMHGRAEFPPAGCAHDQDLYRVRAARADRCVAGHGRQRAALRRGCGYSGPMVDDLPVGSSGQPRSRFAGQQPDACGRARDAASGAGKPHRGTRRAVVSASRRKPGSDAPEDHRRVPRPAERRLRDIQSLQCLGERLLRAGRFRRQPPRARRLAGTRRLSGLPARGREAVPHRERRDHRHSRGAAARADQGHAGHPRGGGKAGRVDRQAVPAGRGGARGADDAAQPGRADARAAASPGARARKYAPPARGAVGQDCRAKR